MRSIHRNCSASWRWASKVSLLYITANRSTYILLTNSFYIFAKILTVEGHLDFGSKLHQSPCDFNDAHLTFRKYQEIFQIWWQDTRGGKGKWRTVSQNWTHFVHLQFICGKLPISLFTWEKPLCRWNARQIPWQDRISCLYERQARKIWN